MSSTQLPRHRAAKPLTRLMRGFETLSLDPGSRLRDLSRDIESRNTVAEAWNQTAEVLQASMTRSLRSNDRSG